jgi:hypothetical protein
MDKVMARSFLWLSFISHEAVLLDPNENSLIALRGNFSSEIIRFYPNNILAPFVPPGLHQFPRVFQVFASGPQKNKGWTFTDLPNF